MVLHESQMLDSSTGDASERLTTFVEWRMYLECAYNLAPMQWVECILACQLVGLITVDVIVSVIAMIVMIVIAVV